MAQFNGDLGWIATSPEAVAYGTAGILGDMVYHHPISASLKLQENRSVPPTLSTFYHAGVRLATWIDGSVTIGHTDQQAEMGDIYSHMASVSSTDYTFGGTPTIDSLTFFCDIDDVEYDFTGCIVRGITWNLSASEYSTVNLDVIGQAVAKWGGAARTPTTHDTAEIVTPGDLSTFTIGGTSLAGCVKGATINWTWATTDIGRQRCGTTVIPQPLRVGRRVVTATFNLELDDATNADTVDVLDDFISNTSLGTIILDEFTLAGCVATGELPDLSTGLTDVTLSVIGTGLLVGTT